jgi:multiple sugar transport system substrate-binding protein
LGAQADSLAAENVVLDMRLPGYFSYTEVVEIELSKALAGEESAQEALDNVAKEWNRLTDEFGRDKQLAAYRAAMGLPAK